MKLTKGKKHKKVMPENTIPLINIVFLMLIFFLIAGTVAPPVSSTLKPPSSQQLPLMPPAGNAVEILSDGTLVHHGETVSLEDILARFPSPAADPAGEVDGQSEPVHILADKMLPASILMPILQAFRAQGHRKIRLVTIKGEK